WSASRRGRPFSDLHHFGRLLMPACIARNRSATTRGSVSASRPSSPVLSATAVQEMLSDVQLRDYQHAAVQKALAARLDLTQVHLLESPTGAGKTAVGTALIGCFLVLL